MTANVREDIDFDEVEGDLLSFQQDALVQEALSKGVDLVRSSVGCICLVSYSYFTQSSQPGSQANQIQPRQKGRVYAGPYLYLYSSLYSLCQAM